MGNILRYLLIFEARFKDSRQNLGNGSYCSGGLEQVGSEHFFPNQIWNQQIIIREPDPSLFLKAEKCHCFRIQSKGEELQDEGPTL
jgi:hypothetical protein